MDPRPGKRRARSRREASIVAPALIDALALIELAGAARARAEPLPTAAPIAWSAPAGCPDAASVTADVERILGRRLAGTAAEGRARATVRRDGDGPFLLHLETTGRDGTHVRELRGETCEDVARATAAIIALAIDAGASGGSPPPPIAAPPAPAPAAPPRPPTPAPASPPRPPPDGAPGVAPLAASRLRGALRAAGGLDATSLPRLAPTATLAGALLVGRVRVEGFGGYAAGQRALLPGSGPPRGGDLRLAYGGARACYLALPARIELWGCAGMEAGAMFGTGFGVARPVSASAVWVAPSFGALGVLRLASWIGLAIQLDGVVPLARRSFVLAGRGEVFQPPPISFRAALGVEIRFP